MNAENVSQVKVKYFGQQIVKKDFVHVKRPKKTFKNVIIAVVVNLKFVFRKSKATKKNTK